MATDILYVAYNRLAFTRETFTALLENTNWEHVVTLFVRDDGSDDGTAEWLIDRCDEFQATGTHVNVVFNGERWRGPVASMNWYLDQHTEADRFAKIDNDFVVCPGWIDEMLKIMTAKPELSILGMEPWHEGPPVPVPDGQRRITEARHIGGKGIIRKRIFDTCRPSPNGHNGYGGFTEWQCEHEDVTKAWICPDLPCFGIDQLPFEPWASLAAEYTEKRWSRSWGPYGTDGTFDAYWDWWTPRFL